MNAAETSDGRTSLMLACKLGHLGVVRELLGHGVKVNAAQASNG